MHESMFGYQLTRPYPYRWFAYVVWLGGLVALALFSMVSLAANGYTTTIIFVTNPNETEHPGDPAWYQKSPWSLASKVTSTCQPQTITVGSIIYTTNLGLPYRVEKLFDVKQNQSHPKVAMAYKNDAFRDCIVSSMEVHALGDFGWNFDVTIYCIVYESFTPTTMTLTTSFITVFYGITSTDLPSFISLDQTTSPALYWGQKTVGLHNALLGNYVPQLDRGTWDFGDQTLPYLTQSGTFRYSYEQGENFGIAKPNASAYDTITTEAWSLTFGKDVLAHDWMYVRQNGKPEAVRVSDLQEIFTSVSLYADGLAKAVRAVILTDLGQSVPSNVFASPQKTVDFINATLQFHQSALAQANGTLWWNLMPNVNDTDPLFHPESLDPAAFYDRTGTGIPDVQPAFISGQYLCQVPKMKSAVSLIISVIVADLVFLQALWTILNWAATIHLQRVNTEAMYCIGCAKLGMVGSERITKDGYELPSVGSAHLRRAASRRTI